MTLTEEQRKSFEEVARPLIKWLNENCHPHSIVEVTPVSAEVFESVTTCVTSEFIKD